MEDLNTWIKAKRGRNKLLSEALGVVPGAITNWPQVPAKHLFKVSEITGIPKYILRPDLVTMTGQAA